MKRKSSIIIAFIVFGIVSSSAQDLQSLQLPPPQKEIGKPLMQALNLRQSSRSFDSKALSLQEISNIMWAAYGITRP